MVPLYAIFIRVKKNVIFKVNNDLRNWNKVRMKLKYIGNIIQIKGIDEYKCAWKFDTNSGSIRNMIAIVLILY